MLVKNCTLIKPLSCKKDTSVVEVAKILKDNKQRRILVVGENDEPVGIISTTDMNNRVVAENKDASGLRAEEIMSSPVYLTCDINENLNDVFKKMVEQESFFCPVTEKKRLVGILTYGEVLRRVQSNLENG